AAGFGATAARTRRRTNTAGAPAVAGNWERRAQSDAAVGLVARTPGGARLRRAAWPCADRPARRVAERRAFRGGAAPALRGADRGRDRRGRGGRLLARPSVPRLDLGTQIGRAA